MPGAGFAVDVAEDGETALVLAGENLYATNEEGRTYIFKAKPTEFELVAENKLGDGFVASPAVAGKALILRSKTHVYRIESP